MNDGSDAARDRSDADADAADDRSVAEDDTTDAQEQAEGSDASDDVDEAARTGASDDVDEADADRTDPNAPVEGSAAEALDADAADPGPRPERDDSGTEQNALATEARDRGSDAADSGARGDASSEDGGNSGADADDSDADADESKADRDDSDAAEPTPGVPDPDADDGPTPDYVPEDVRKYERFTKMDGAQYERVNDFLRDRTYVTAREWAIARLCADFRTETGVEMTKIGENLPELVPFMTDTYTPQAVNQARSSFDDKVRKAGATFLYGAMCDFYTAEELDDVMYEVTEVSKFLLEVEGVDLSVDDELEAEERISSVMREVREASKALRDEELSAEE